MALCAPYDKTGIDQVQAERLSMSWIERIKSNITPTRKASIPEGVWTKCDSCGQVLYRAELERNLEVCPKCDHHMRMSARNRLHSLLDEGSLVELGSELEPKDVLKFRDSKKYKDRCLFEVVQLSLFPFCFCIAWPTSVSCLKKLHVPC